LSISVDINQHLGVDLLKALSANQQAFYNFSGNYIDKYDISVYCIWNQIQTKNT